MTQITNRYNVTVRDEFDHCEHVQTGGKAYRAIYETDCCGPVGVYACCKECSEKIDAREDEEEVTCHDCGQDFPRKDTVEWKPYDFYAPQGDEPLVICNSCRMAEKHLERRRKDKADREAEFDEDDRDYDEVDDLLEDVLTEDECQLDSTFFDNPPPKPFPEAIGVTGKIGVNPEVIETVEDERVVPQSLAEAFRKLNK